MLDKKTKEKIIKKFRVHESDTGSTQVQIAILSEEIKQLTDHLKQHKQDNSSRRGLLKKVGERRKFLKYLQKESAEQFKELATKLKLKIADKLIAEEEEEKLRQSRYTPTKNDEEEEVEEEPKDLSDLEEEKIDEE
ncbi:30S ribosomal protein S15 [Candidatus Falkowbacteria bacterium]|nr:30S ribosomal protein S15 [Candidatus Falkowbacteria bacterium]